MIYTKDAAIELLTNYKSKENLKKRYPNSLLPSMPRTRRENVERLAGVLQEELAKLNTLPDIPESVYENMAHMLEYRILFEYLEYKNDKLTRENTKVKKAFKTLREMLAMAAKEEEC